METRNPYRSSKRIVLCFVFACGLLFTSVSAEAYVGPGAGFAFMSSFLILFTTFILAFLTLLTWPIRWLIKSLLRIKRHSKSRVKRVVILGLDGQDPELTEQFMKEGMLPNFERLRRMGVFNRLQTTLPAESPVAWSSFQTGCNPGKHRIYDFLVPNRKSLLPELSSANVTTTSRTLNIGKYKIPLGKPHIQVGRKSQPFWSVLGKYGIFSTILRVPITFPPEKFNGLVLSAMCVPDIKGSQGTYYYYSSDPNEIRQLTSGMQLPLQYEDGVAKGWLTGPENSLVKEKPELQAPFELYVGENHHKQAELIINKQKYPLTVGEYTPWIPIEYRPGLGMKIRGICRFLLLQKSPYVKLYVTPIQIDPEKPALPISHPMTFSIYLAKQQGPYATLGVAEDTSALNEHIIDENAFLEQCYQIHHEREAMFFDALEKTRRGAVVCVFDITDRLQHMFMRFITDDHPANRGNANTEYNHVIKKLYQEMDDLVGRTLARIDDQSVLMVMSDHGFKPFKRGVNLNAWLLANGFLTVKENAAGADMLQDIDWSKTQAYAVGFGGIYLNLAGREAKGIVQPGEEAESLKRHISEKLLALIDEQTQQHPVRQVYDRNKVYKGPYVNDAPDLIAGFRVGYRAAWEGVTGGIGKHIIEDNVRPWSGDHNMNPPDVPGMFFCNRPIQKPDPHIQDIAPTVLDLFGVPIPNYMDGESLMPNGSNKTNSFSRTENNSLSQPSDDEPAPSLQTQGELK